MPKTCRARGGGLSRGSGHSGHSAWAPSRPSPSAGSTPGPNGSSPGSLGAAGSQDSSVAGSDIAEFLSLIREEVHQQLSSQMSQLGQGAIPPTSVPLPTGGIESPSSVVNSDVYCFYLSIVFGAWS
uniref:Uncharacterized protein n=1 Tax=Amphimedon queenslandica TaxID=400682 RepID=A0A1X7US19_AMPQE